MPQWRKADQLQLTYLKKEANYGTAATFASTSALSLSGFTGGGMMNWKDVVVDDGDTLNGYQFATKQEVVRYDAGIKLHWPRAFPLDVAAMAAYAMGNLVTSVQDGTKVAYRHRIVPVGLGTEVPSMSGLEKVGGNAYSYKGIKVDGFSMSGSVQDPFIQFDADLLTDGSRTSDGTSTFEAGVAASHPWLKQGNVKAWIEGTASNITINTAPTFGSQAISSATPTDVKARLMAWNFAWKNNLRGNYGYTHGSGAYRGKLDKGIATADFGMLLEYSGTTEIGWLTNQSKVAVDIDITSGTLVATGGTYYYGVKLVIPAVQFRAVDRQEGEGGIVLVKLDGTILNDGTNNAVCLFATTNHAAYAAA